MQIEYKNIDGQIELIKSKNILIKDEERAKDILFRENYYNLITGYKDIFIDIKNSKKRGIETYSEETYFEEIYAVYKFDRELRNIMLNYISIIETNVKSYIANIFSNKYGTYDYLKEENFYITPNNRREHNELIKRVTENLNRNIEIYDDIKECKVKYGTVPLWMLTTLMTFGNIIKFYTLMKIEDKKEIANFFRINYRDMQTFLRMLNVVRNIAAHGNILFNLKLDITYPVKGESYYHELLKILKVGDSYQTGINDILAIIIILKRFLQNSEYKKLIKELQQAIDDVKEELDNISFENFMEEMGLPENLINF